LAKNHYGWAIYRYHDFARPYSFIGIAKRDYRMTNQHIHVVIVGAGLGGLCLAQGLKRHGISFAVYERDCAADSRTQGYRIRIDEAGQRALAACLPKKLNDLFRQTCSITRSEGQFLNPHLEAIGGRPSESWRPSATPSDGEAAIGDRSANRLTLREILLTGIEEHVHFGKAFERYEEQENDTVRVLLDDGETVIADLLVGADGVNSSVRQQRFPLLEPEDSGATCIYGKTFVRSDGAVAAALMSGTSVIFAENLAVIVDSMSFNFPSDAPALTPVQDYLYWAIIGRTAALDSDGESLLYGRAAKLRQTVERLSDAWHPGLRAVFAEADAATVVALPVRCAATLSPWISRHVTLLGDAIHAMSPAGGVGANTAFEDAAMLAAAVVDAATDRCPLRMAVADYETGMRARANAAIRASMDGARRLFNETASPT
jgi:salicylate hydroxylase